MSQASPGIEETTVRQRLADLSLRLKLYIGLGALVAGLLLIGGINTLTSVRTQELVGRTLVRQRRLADLAAKVNNNLLNIQNQAFEFYDTWTVNGFEQGVSSSGFGYARAIYLDPIQEQLGQIREDIADMKQQRPDAGTSAKLETILANVDVYENALVEMSDQMEQLGLRDTGAMRQIRAIRTEVQSQFEKTDLEHLQSTLLRIGQYEQDFFLSSNLAAARLTRESINLLIEQVTNTDDAQLSPTDKVALVNTLERYYDHFLAAASRHRKLQNIRPNLVGQSDLISVLVRQLYQEQQADFSAALERLQHQQSNAMTTTVGLTILALLGGPAIAYYITRQAILPIKTLGESAARLGTGDLEARAPVHSRDEIGTTAIAFNLMAERLQELLAGLERRVADRTADLEATMAELATRTVDLEQAHQRQVEINRQLEATAHQSRRRATMLQANAEVSRAATQIRDLDALLPQVTRLISQHFGFYHVGVFLIDEARRYAVLKAANSQGGQRMLTRNHRLAVGSQGIVGYVTDTGEPRIALDVGIDAVFFDNPDLPDTHSEMALPLRISDEVIGALDVQSTEEAAFTEEDINVLTALADQIAIAIENAHLFRQSQTALEEAQRTQRRYLQQQWSQFTQERPTLAYEYNLSGVPSSGDEMLPETEKAFREGTLVMSSENNLHHLTASDRERASARAALAVPIQVRGQTIGILDLQEIDDEHIWTSDEVDLVQAVADQLGLAIEGARLFEQTQASLAETQTLFQTSRSLAVAQQAEEIWSAVVNAAGQRGADACGLFLFDAEQPESTHQLVLVKRWDKQDHPRLSIGTLLSLGASPPLDIFGPDRPLAVTELSQAEDIAESTRDLFQDLGFSAVLFQPIVAHGRWFGLLAILYEAPHAFSKAETDFYRTLADQAALAVESQSLLFETQRRAQREQLIRHITDKVRSTSNLETILQTTVRELSKAMGLPRAFVRLGTEADLTVANSTRRQSRRDDEQGTRTDLEEERDD
jgi:GAF domain-containing protein/HAMP domain-containing protein